eukprot:TRINITY_DN69214_c0_g1_i1.p1 TRINITY_DN69214_c0_g1~~TRINITY_DN69214_c0_g1_i1.p1  ORF type:complete len:797 (+),score=190.93 TRINITY_DN69214_c0_g1_i1:421-2811(+)
MLSKAIPSSEAREFEFDTAFGPESTQEDVYRTIAEPLVDGFLAGYNGTLFAYGQTGTGKTFTMGILDRVSMKTGGLVPSSLRHVFGSLQESTQRNFKVTMNFLQIYMENIQDLLNPSSGRPVVLREKPGHGFYAEGHEEVEVFCIEDAVELINNGLENRVMAPTLMNATSSRSHTVITITLKKEVSPAKTIVSRFRLVDLAGSERVRKTKSSGARLEEAKSINQSLSCLGNVIGALTNPDAVHIPYRDSKLTRLCQDSLGGNSNTFLLATVGPSPNSFQETLSTLLFAQRCMQVKSYAVVNAEINFQELCLHYEAEIEQLKAVLKQSAVLTPSEAPQNGLSESAETAWKMVYLLYDVIKEVHGVSTNPINAMHGHQSEMHGFWSEHIERFDQEEERIREERLMLSRFDPLRTVKSMDSSLPDAVASVQSRYPSLHGQDGPVSPSAASSHPEIEHFKRIEDFVRHVQEIRLEVIRNAEYSTSLMQKKDKAYEYIKLDMIHQLMERNLQVSQVKNWSRVVKHLLKQNRALRSSKGIRDRPATLHAFQITRLIRCVTILQRKFRERRLHRGPQRRERMETPSPFDGEQKPDNTKKRHLRVSMQTLVGRFLNGIHLVAPSRRMFESKQAHLLSDSDPSQEGWMDEWMGQQVQKHLKEREKNVPEAKTSSKGWASTASIPPTTAASGTKLARRRPHGVPAGDDDDTRYVPRSSASLSRKSWTSDIGSAHKRMEDSLLAPSMTTQDQQRRRRGWSMSRTDGLAHAASVGTHRREIGGVADVDADSDGSDEEFSQLDMYLKST